MKKMTIPVNIIQLLVRKEFNQQNISISAIIQLMKVSPSGTGDGRRSLWFKVENLLFLGSGGLQLIIPLMVKKTPLTSEFLKTSLSSILAMSITAIS